MKASTIPSMLSLWRRHLKACPHTKRHQTKCSCPIWCDGKINGERVRRPLDTRDWGRAGRKLAELEQSIESGRDRKPIDEAVTAFVGQCDIEDSTRRKYERWSRFLREHAATHGLVYMDEFDLDALDAYKDTREVCALTWSKELQFLRSLFSFAVKRKWCPENPAKDMDMPDDPKPGDRPPYTRDEITSIIAACDTFGRRPYERLRAKAMVLLLRFYALRVSDVATLERSRVRAGQIMTRAMKNGELLWLPLYPEVQRALDCLPLPQGASADCLYYFWTGKGAREGHIKTVDRTLRAVFDASGVANAKAHRFRHTLATEILANGFTVEDAANILGDDPDTIRRYYLKWSPAYQARTVEIMQRIHGGSSQALALTGHAGVNDGITGVNAMPWGMLEVGVDLSRNQSSLQPAETPSGVNPESSVKTKLKARTGHVGGER